MNFEFKLKKEGKIALDYCIDKNCREILEDYESHSMNPLNESIISCDRKLDASI